MSASSSSDGLLATACRIGETLLATVQNRVEILANDMQEEKRRLVETLLLAAALAAFGIMALTLATFAFVMLFGENGRLIALGGLSLLYAAIAVWFWILLQRRMNRPAPLRDTLNELSKDRECLNRNQI